MNNNLWWITNSNTHCPLEKSTATDPLYGEALVVVLHSNSYKSLLHYPTTCSYMGTCIISVVHEIVATCANV